MVTSHFEDRVFEAIHDVEVAAVDTARSATRNVMELVPVTVTDLTKMVDACYDFTGRILELQLDAARRLATEIREAEAPTSAPRKAPRKAPRARKPAAAKAVAA